MVLVGMVVVVLIVVVVVVVVVLVTVVCPCCGSTYLGTGEGGEPKAGLPPVWASEGGKLRV